MIRCSDKVGGWFSGNHQDSCVLSDIETLIKILTSPYLFSDYASFRLVRLGLLGMLGPTYLTFLTRLPPPPPPPPSVRHLYEACCYISSLIADYNDKVITAIRLQLQIKNLLTLLSRWSHWYTTTKRNNKTLNSVRRQKTRKTRTDRCSAVQCSFSQ